MKRGILLIVLVSFLGMAIHAQTKKTTAKKKTTTSAKGKLAKKAKGDTSKNQVKIAVTNIPLGDTSKKGVPLNFERPLDGYYVKNAVKTAKPTAYAALRESDVVFAKRVWREIDLRDRMNQYLASPKSRLIDVLMDAIANGELTAYDAAPNAAKGDPNGDEFSTPLTPAQAKAKMADSTAIHIINKQTGEDEGVKRVAGEFNPDSIVRFRIKEDWIFDKQRSVYEPRIIGIAPLYRPKAAGVAFDFQPAFWIYFPEARKVLATKEIMMRRNDASSISFDQAFLKRIFASYIVKVSNEKDERIKDYTQGIDQLYEAERIKKELMDWELNLWQY
jgi:gliding motility associated protien GldN